MAPEADSWGGGGGGNKKSSPEVISLSNNFQSNFTPAEGWRLKTGPLGDASGKGEAGMEGGQGKTSGRSIKLSLVSFIHRRCARGDGVSVAAVTYEEGIKEGGGLKAEGC